MNPFKPSAQHRAYILLVYKHILSESCHFFDDRARTFLVNRARKIFKEYRSCTDEARIKSKILDARKHLHSLQRANDGNIKSALRLLESAYGRKGKVRHCLLHPYIHNLPADFQYPAPFVPHVPHTAPPPPLCGPLCALVKKGLEKPLEPQLPVPLFKPLHPGRKANLLWRWRSNLLSRVALPLPFEIVAELERKAGADPTHPLHVIHTMEGGPKWEDMYSGKETDPDLMHLYPSARLVPLSQVNRSRYLPPSPYQAPPSPYATLTMIRLLDPSFEHEHIKSSVRKILGRKQRRCYRKLLVHVPLIRPFPSATSLWDDQIEYKISKSRWIPASTLTLLSEDLLPDEKVMEDTLSLQKPKKKRGRY
ncbi:uncharacterized protein BYT42DRAFT_618834 [Radiomyces spectabilis]|uniref:uncharacterized protein n=1 Tax=Radiomyces spectabilis TaxID=64574 RepID=UPI00221F7376|nr:uncharacterized protein BYT42DRAFT_618834 [Radiomyces spectabilis]KAI8364681.1 hypothetical protein BYT42DRAFT_618834 [Radiomyces spectabilis]